MTENNESPLDSEEIYESKFKDRYPILFEQRQMEKEKEKNQED